MRENAKKKSSSFVMTCLLYEYANECGHFLTEHAVVHCTADKCFLQDSYKYFRRLANHHHHHRRRRRRLFQTQGP